MKNQLTITLLLLSTISAFAQVPNYVPTNGLVGWWPFNGNAEDLGPNGLDGTPNGAILTSDRDGNANSAYFFNGVSDHINMNSSVGLPMMNSPRTISVWMNPSSVAGSWTYTAVAYGSPSNSQAFMVGLGDGVVSVQGWANDFSPQYGYSADQWIHVACTYDGSIVTIYLNGTFFESDNIANWNTVASEFLFGARPSMGYGFFHGILDDIGIWDRVLTEGEIDAIANSSSSVPPPCLASTPPVITGLASSYTISSLAVPLTGSPSNGLFFGQGMVDTTFVPSAAGLGTHTIMYTYVDANGCIGTVGTCVDVTLDVGTGSGAHLSDNSGPEVYPNPGTGLYAVTIQGMSGTITIVVTDSRGRSVHSATVQVMGTKSMHNIDLTHCANGVYTITTRSANATQTQKLVKR